MKANRTNRLDSTFKPAVLVTVLTFGLYVLIPWGIVLYPKDCFCKAEVTRVWLN
jgi:hypothetical protein